MILLEILEAIWQFFSPRPAAPRLVGVSFAPSESRTMSQPLTGTFEFVSTPPPGGGCTVTYTVNGDAGGVVASTATFACSTGDVIAATAVNTSAGGVASKPSETFTITAVDNTPAPAAPAFAGISFAPAESA